MRIFRRKPKPTTSERELLTAQLEATRNQSADAEDARLNSIKEGQQ